MFGIGGDARRYGLLSIAKPRRAAAGEAASVVSVGEAPREVVVDAAPGAGAREAKVCAAVERLVLARSLPFPAWRSLTRC